ncbi:GtrA family protein [Microvirga sp. SRT01]|uniref:GtrA family protein n=1 Tax=Sphingomonas longa TaxID=2778730 RepID=A0ABS2D7D3_9SPHN|nr:GtrA family protein [Microvirga sp. SRT01]MBM6576808.1 GtrA family protein [Sphingomonas sp. BT552]MBR7709853.1 GtrA family protein [Microvirga sp. SRT01]
MASRIEQWRTSGVLGQLVRFGVTGVAVTLFYAAVYWPLATYVMNPNLAVLVAFVLATAVGRFAHGAVSFRGHGTRDRGTAVRFTIVQALGFLLNQGFTWALVTGPFVHGPTWWPLVPAVFVVPLVTFGLQRNWVFR